MSRKEFIDFIQGRIISLEKTLQSCDPSIRPLVQGTLDLNKRILETLFVD